MPATYMTHQYNGATHAYDRGEVERLEKLGWKVTPMPTAADILKQKGADRVAALKAETAALEAELAGTGSASKGSDPDPTPAPTAAPAPKRTTPTRRKSTKHAGA